jgi:hypothetical protein
MTRRLFLFVCLSLLLLPTLAAQAQQAPDTIDAALSDLSKQVGKTVTINDLDNWTFSGELFPDTSLGCAQPGKIYSQVQTSGVQFILVYQGVSYDYRVSADKNIVVLCGTSEVRPPCPPPDDPAYLPPRLSVGVQGRVVSTGIPNNIRQQPGSSSQLLGEIPTNAVFNVIGGPSCSTLDKLVWWKVQYNGIEGWTAEGKDQEYWLEPLNLTGTPLPLSVAKPQPITPANATQVTQLSSPEGGTGIAALMGNGQTLAIAMPGGSVILYNVDTNVPSAPMIVGQGDITALAFGANTALLRFFLATATSDNMIRLWNVNTDSTLQQIAELQNQSGAVVALAFSGDGTLLAAGDANGSIYLIDASNGTLLSTLTGHTASVKSLQFSGSVLFSTDANGGTRIWGVIASVG